MSARGELVEPFERGNEGIAVGAVREQPLHMKPEQINNTYGRC